jgi:drug/metabolite transporter (DMT)-like permease
MLAAPNPIAATIYSELVLSLYPILIKTVNTNIFTQILARFIVFPTLALTFGSSNDFTAIWSNPYEIFVSILHNLLNLGHVAASYVSFKNLSVGTAISLFYLYPIFNIIAASVLFGESMSLTSIFLIAIAFIGVYLIATSHKDSDETHQNKATHDYGVIMGILAALSETMIFIFIRSNKNAQASPYYTVNHLYPAGLALLALVGIYKPGIVDTSKISWAKLIGFNAFLGFTGYIARFYAIPKIPTIVFSLLAFLGVSFGYLWGVLIMGDKPTTRALFGGGLIAAATAILRYLGIV